MFHYILFFIYFAPHQYFSLTSLSWLCNIPFSDKLYIFIQPPLVGGPSGLPQMFSFKQCSQSILRAKFLHTALLIPIGITPRSRLNESRMDTLSLMWSPETLQGNSPLSHFRLHVSQPSVAEFSICSCCLYC